MQASWRNYCLTIEAIQISEQKNMMTFSTQQIVKKTRDRSKTYKRHEGMNRQLRRSDQRAQSNDNIKTRWYYIQDRENILVNEKTQKHTRFIGKRILNFLDQISEQKVMMKIRPVVHNKS